MWIGFKLTWRIGHKLTRENSSQNETEKHQPLKILSSKKAIKNVISLTSRPRAPVHPVPPAGTPGGGALPAHGRLKPSHTCIEIGRHTVLYRELNPSHPAARGGGEWGWIENLNSANITVPRGTGLFVFKIDLLRNQGALYCALYCALLQTVNNVNLRIVFESKSLIW